MVKWRTPTSHVIGPTYYYDVNDNNDVIMTSRSYRPAVAVVPIAIVAKRRGRAAWKQSQNH